MAKRALTDGEIMRQEYHKALESWMSIHCRTLSWMVFVAVAMEILLFFILSAIQEISASPQGYLLRYVLAPLLANGAMLGAALAAKRSARLGDALRPWVVSLAGAGIAIVLYAVHQIFPAMTLALVIPVSLTVVYGKKSLTGAIGGVCLAGKILTDLFVRWDTEVGRSIPSAMDLANYGLCLLLLMLIYVLCVLMVQLSRRQIDFAAEVTMNQQLLLTRAITDSLTGVGNRQALRESIQQLERDCDEPWFFAMMDMDGFKRINDELGHGRGDHYLQIFGSTLLRHEGENFQAFRFGGDEFCALICGGTPEAAMELCRRIQAEYTGAVKDEDETVVGISIGLTTYRPGEAASQMLNRADAVLYRAKKTKNGISFHAEDIEKK